MLRQTVLPCLLPGLPALRGERGASEFSCLQLNSLHKGTGIFEGLTGNSLEPTGNLIERIREVADFERRCSKRICLKASTFCITPYRSRRLHLK
jgi:hypothetical protein